MTDDQKRQQGLWVTRDRTLHDVNGMKPISVRGGNCDQRFLQGVAVMINNIRYLAFVMSCYVNIGWGVINVS